MSARRFAIFSALGALIWAVVIGGLGWVFGGTAQLLLGEIHHVAGWLLLALAVVALAVGAWRWHRAG